MAKIKQLSRRKIPTTQLTLGMYVCGVDKPWEETPFLFQGFPIHSQADIDAVQTECEHVYVDDARFTHIQGTSNSPLKNANKKSKSNLTRGIQPKSLADSVEKAHITYSKGSTLIKKTLFDLQLGVGLDTKACKSFVTETVDRMLENESAMLWFNRLKAQDEYTSQHCLSVAILSIGFARFLGCEYAELKTIGLCGLLHDVGKMKVDQDILNKPGKLSDSEFTLMKSHAQKGYELLIGHKDLPSTVIDVAYSHHERLDGTGYPRGLTKEQIPQRALLISICDVYDAITSHRVYDNARAPMEALKVLMKGRNTQFDDSLVVKFIEWLGVFPVGTLIKLNTGETAIILETNPEFRLRPVAVVLRDEHGNPCRPRRLNLAQVCMTPSGKPYKITESLADGSLGLYANSDEVKKLLNEKALKQLIES